ncbi:MAG TPA: isochorismatase family cysteine hydrolase [Fimbriimonadaceae bacterium]|nr:isochorismatase family cysteine hydrolase [Fimbriimonadaceae bacterium]HVM35544.1 isochorismatase family cysteine hydrolase [Actinomycetota bacterium]
MTRSPGGYLHLELAADRQGHTMGNVSGHGGHTYRLRGDSTTGYTAERTALLVIDPVNDFLSEGGAAWDLTRGTVTKHDVVGHLAQAIHGGRSRRIPVLFAPMAYTRDDYDDEQLQRRSGIHRVMFEREMFLAGSWGADFHPDLKPAEDEIVLTPHKGSDVFETDLPDQLERLGTSHLVISGLLANLCCEGTGRHASEHGYDVTFLRDAIGAVNLPSYEASIRINYPLIGNAVLDVAAFLHIVDSGGTPPAEGDTVIGSDQLKIGTVQQVVPEEADRPGYLLVPRGIFNRDTHIPLGAITKTVPGTVYVHLPRLVVKDMPWDQAPTGQAVTRKLGPSRDEVPALYGSMDPTADRG